MNLSYDVIIVGAGLSGIGAGRQLIHDCPETNFCILESRTNTGGTWDLFQYPGIRSDSDMYTMGYSSKPWSNPEAIAKGQSILSYIREAADEVKLNEKIHLSHKVMSASWSDDLNSWELQVQAPHSLISFTCKLLYVCSGYYDYEKAYTPSFNKQEIFKGKIVHPQFWDKNLKCDNKKITVVGSGATAMTIVPEVSKKAQQVNMLQRSPTYVVSLPSKDYLAKLTGLFLPKKINYTFTRWRYVKLQRFLYKKCKTSPEFVKAKLLKLLEKQLPKNFNIKKHFTPRYNPWEQRLCLVPDGDFFKSIRDGKTNVITDEIEEFYEHGIILKSGDRLLSDIVILATGLNLKLLGGIDLFKNGAPIKISDEFSYKGLMFSNIPNLVYSLGYINASWTLRSDITSEFVCRVINQMTKQNNQKVIPILPNGGCEEGQPLSAEFSPGYIKRGEHMMAKQGDSNPWRFNQDYSLDKMLIKETPLEDGYLKFI